MRITLGINKKNGVHRSTRCDTLTAKRLISDKDVKGITISAVSISTEKEVDELMVFLKGVKTILRQNSDKNDNKKTGREKA